MKSKIIADFKLIPKYVWILGLVMLVSIFLRTYHFEAWLQFNPDQVRDATVIDGVIAHGQYLPLLGTIAGGTNFHLGPMFYYFQYASALIFGNTPQAMAYPDLFFSTLAIGLLFLFLQKYFSRNLSLALTAVMSVSYFAVSNSRFAWNPNSIPFFVLLFLYALLEMLDQKNKRVYRWSWLAGLALGVGVQLHTLLLLILPVVTAVVVIYLIWKKSITWKSVAIVFLFAIFLNFPQILSEIRTNGANTAEFFLGSTTQTNRATDTRTNIGNIVSCSVEFNFHMISSYENKELCVNILATDKATLRKYAGVPGNFADDKQLFIASVIVSLLFSLGGYVLWVFYFRREKDVLKRNFLGLVLLFNLISMMALVPVASHITMRYFIILFFVPFVLLGLWAKFLLEKNKEKLLAVLVGILVILIIVNLSVVLEVAQPYTQNSVNDVNNSILGETQLMADFVMSSAGTQQHVSVGGEKLYVKRFFPALEYLCNRSKIQLTEITKENALQEQPSSIIYIANTGNTGYEVGDSLNNCIVESSRDFNAITIFNLKNCAKQN